jgi:hypothetical protein
MHRFVWRVDRRSRQQLAALFEQLLDTFGVQLFTRIKSNMKNCLMPLLDKLLLRKRAILENIVGQFKNISHIGRTPSQPNQLIVTTL